MRIVLDTTALVRAHAGSQAVARHILEAIIARGHTLLLSNEMIAETSRVLRYPRLRALYGLSDGDVFEYTQTLRSIAEIVMLEPAYNAPLRDASDLMVLQTAERGRRRRTVLE